MQITVITIERLIIDPEDIVKCPLPTLGSMNINTKPLLS